MFDVTFISPDGHATKVQVAEGQTLMQAAVHNSVPGIDADCGGSCACATCHVYVEPDWIDRLPPQQEAEKSLLQFANAVEDNSRLACQITINEGLNGLTVRVPVAQH